MCVIVLYVETVVAVFGDPLRCEVGFLEVTILRSIASYLFSIGAELLLYRWFPNVN